MELIGAFGACIVLLAQLTAAKVGLDESVLTLDWSADNFLKDAPIRNFLVEYSPPIGLPRSPVVVSANVFNLLLNDTLPATEYRVSVSALLADGSQSTLLDKVAPSSPIPPILDEVVAYETQAIVTFFPPTVGGADLSYYLEYHPINSGHTVQSLESDQTSVVLLDLRPGVDYDLRIHSVYKGVPSSRTVRRRFRTAQRKVRPKPGRTQKKSKALAIWKAIPAAHVPAPTHAFNPAAIGTLPLIMPQQWRTLAVTNVRTMTTTTPVPLRIYPPFYPYQKTTGRSRTTTSTPSAAPVIMRVYQPIFPYQLPSTTKRPVRTRPPTPQTANPKTRRVHPPIYPPWATTTRVPDRPKTTSRIYPPYYPTVTHKPIKTSFYPYKPETTTQAATTQPQWRSTSVAATPFYPTFRQYQPRLTTANPIVSHRPIKASFYSYKPETTTRAATKQPQWPSTSVAATPFYPTFRQYQPRLTTANPIVSHRPMKASFYSYKPETTTRVATTQPQWRTTSVVATPFYPTFHPFKPRLTTTERTTAMPQWYQSYEPYQETTTEAPTFKEWTTTERRTYRTFPPQTTTPRPTAQTYPTTNYQQGTTSEPRSYQTFARPVTKVAGKTYQPDDVYNWPDYDVTQTYEPQAATTASRTQAPVSRYQTTARTEMPYLTGVPTNFIHETTKGVYPAASNQNQYTNPQFEATTPMTTVTYPVVQPLDFYTTPIVITNTPASTMASNEQLVDTRPPVTEKGYFGSAQILADTPATSAELFESVGQQDTDQVQFDAEGNLLRISWNRPQPSVVVCDGFSANYVVVSLHEPKAFRENSTDTFVLIKMFRGHKLQVTIECLRGGYVDVSWAAFGSVDLSAPTPVQNFTLARIVTDEYYRASALLEWIWPKHHDFEKFTVVIVYFPKTSGKAGLKKSLELSSFGPANITGLTPSTEYLFTVKNTSRLGLNSKIKAVKGTTPPIISSTLYPGKLSSTSININFSPTDNEEAIFNSYELVFAGAGDAKNITRSFSRNTKQTSLTFTSLIPGRTYHFVVFTVYKGVRSRPVKQDITTYPTKVKKIYPIVKATVVDLDWTLDEYIQDPERLKFKLAYSTNQDGESNPVYVEARRYHRFKNLRPQTWYTFTVTVVADGQESEANAVTVVTLGTNAVAPELKRVAVNKVQISFSRTIFNDANGNIDQYGIIVAEFPGLEPIRYKMPTWAEAKRLEISEGHWPAFQATPSHYLPFGRKDFAKTDATYIVGDGYCDSETADGDYCNGPLKPGVSYWIKVRACSVADICMESDYAGLSSSTAGLIQDADGENNIKKKKSRLLNRGSNLFPFFSSGAAPRTKRTLLLKKVLLPLIIVYSCLKQIVVVGL